MISRICNTLTYLLLTIIVSFGLAACSSPAKLPHLAMMLSLWRSVIV